MSRYNRLYRDRNVDWLGRVAIQIVLRLGCGSRHSARLGHWACRETGHDTAGRRTTRCDTPATRPVLGLQHGQPQPCDTAPCTPRHGAMRARPGRSARNLGAPCAQPGRTMRAAMVHWVCTCAPNPVLDSVHCFSHCLDHCS